ncbi:PepSY domain-containing protein [Shewanella sp. ECSMB14102]|uniref:PepSY domain-containing protein n=1 Tax=Shewanella sp. ECSMB14102 TaxID=1579504 RepID=UPI001F27F2CD|nr:PepSY domain-containing protein [Shewanella sp. ECSMB14102]
MKRGSKIKHQAYHSSGIIAASMLLLSLAFAQPLHAGPFAKPERTTQAQEAKLKVRSGDEAARLVKQAYGGKVLRVQSVKGNGNPGYRVKLLQDSGRIVYVSVDARSGRLQAN